MMNRKSFFCLLVCFLGVTAMASARADEVQRALEYQSLVDMLLQENWREALDQTASMRKRGIDLGQEIVFFEGRALFELGDNAGAEKKLATYIRSPGASGINYRPAVAMMTQVRALLEEEAAFAREEKERQAAAVRHQQEVEKWLASAAVGEVLSVNEEWQFFRIRLNVPATSGKALQIFDAASQRALSLGSLKDLGNGEYTTTADIMPSVGASIYACCKP